LKEFLTHLYEIFYQKKWLKRYANVLGVLQNLG